MRCALTARLQARPVRFVHVKVCSCQALLAVNIRAVIIMNAIAYVMLDLTGVPKRAEQAKAPPPPPPPRAPPFNLTLGHVWVCSGRKKAALTYVATYTFGCCTKHFNNFWILLVGRLFCGVATSLLYSAFESWLVAEHFKVRSPAAGISLCRRAVWLCPVGLDLACRQNRSFVQDLVQNLLNIVADLTDLCLLPASQSMVDLAHADSDHMHVLPHRSCKDWQLMSPWWQMLLFIVLNPAYCKLRQSSEGSSGHQRPCLSATIFHPGSWGLGHLYWSLMPSSPTTAHDRS